MLPVGGVPASGAGPPSGGLPPVPLPPADVSAPPPPPPPLAEEPPSPVPAVPTLPPEPPGWPPDAPPELVLPPVETDPPVAPGPDPPVAGTPPVPLPPLADGSLLHPTVSAAAKQAATAKNWDVAVRRNEASVLWRDLTSNTRPRGRALPATDGHAALFKLLPSRFWNGRCHGASSRSQRRVNVATPAHHPYHPVFFCGSPSPQRSHVATRDNPPTIEKAAPSEAPPQPDTPAPAPAGDRRARQVAAGLAPSFADLSGGRAKVP